MTSSTQVMEQVLPNLSLKRGQIPATAYLDSLTTSSHYWAGTIFVFDARKIYDK